MSSCLTFYYTSSRVQNWLHSYIYQTRLKWLYNKSGGQFYFEITNLACIVKISWPSIVFSFEEMFQSDYFLLFHQLSSCFQLEFVFARKRIRICFAKGLDRVGIGKPIRTLSQPYSNPIWTLSKNGIRVRSSLTKCEDSTDRLITFFNSGWYCRRPFAYNFLITHIKRYRAIKVIISV